MYKYFMFRTINKARIDWHWVKWLEIWGFLKYFLIIMKILPKQLKSIEIDFWMLFENIGNSALWFHHIVVRRHRCIRIYIIDYGAFGLNSSTAVHLDLFHRLRCIWIKGFSTTTVHCDDVPELFIMAMLFII